LLAGCIIPDLLFSQFTQQGSKLVGTGAVGSLVYQGASVSISSDGNTAIVGGSGDNGSSGAVWVFIRNSGVWTQQGSKLSGTGSVGNSDQGYSVAITSNGNTIIEGGFNDNAGTGAVWIFNRSGGVWTQSGQKLVGTNAVGGSSQGYSVAISSNGSTAIEGGYSDNVGTGAAWVFFNPSIGISQISTNVPEKFSLEQNYPNPFNPSTKIKFDVPAFERGEGGMTVLKVYSNLGNEIATLVNDKLQPGTYEVTFNASQYSSGIYFYKLQTDNFSETKKMLLIK
jgi:hypothetical protein